MKFKSKPKEKICNCGLEVYGHKKDCPVFKLYDKEKQPKQVKDWEERFAKEFSQELVDAHNSGEISDLDTEIKLFVSDLLSKARSEAKEELVKEIKEGLDKIETKGIRRLQDEKFVFWVKKVDLLSYLEKLNIKK